jgi:hypothetical protein
MLWSIICVKSCTESHGGQFEPIIHWFMLEAPFLLPIYDSFLAGIPTPGGINVNLVKRNSC